MTDTSKIDGANGANGSMGAVALAPAGHGSPARTVRKAPPLIAAMILDMMRDYSRGHRRSLNLVCRDIGVDPSHAAQWLLNDDKFRADYELARCQRHDDILEECLTIADDKSQDDIIDDKGYRRPNKEWIARSRVRIQTRLDLLARWDPKKYGAKLDLTADVTTRNLNINVPVDPVAAAHAYVDMMRGRPAD